MPLGDSPHFGPPRRPGAAPRRRRPVGRPQRAAAPRADRRESTAPAAPAPTESTPRFTLFVRYILPAVVVLAGVVAMSFGSDTSLEGGAGLVSAGLAIWFVNWLFRLGARGDVERDAEDKARQYFDQHGRWPPER